MLIDTHCHLNDSNKFPDARAEIDLAAAAGVHRMIVVGVRPDEWQATLNLCRKHPELRCTLGWHPNYTEPYDPEKLRDLRTLAEDPLCLAIGEIGLDYHWTYSPKSVQREALQDQLNLAQALGLPVVFHAREAYSDLLDILEARGQNRYLFHCFMGTPEDAVRAAKLGAYFGVDGPLTYKKSDALRSTVYSLPRDRIVLETDAPYLSPEPYRGRPNRPAHIKEINVALASLLGLSAAECETLTTANAVRFFSQALSAS